MANRLAALLGRYRQNWRILRRELARVGAEVEGWPYEALDRDAEEQPPIVRDVDGARLTFLIDRWERRSDDELAICIDASGLPTLAGVKPSYVFFKRRDGSVHYSGRRRRR